MGCVYNSKGPFKSKIMKPSINNTKRRVVFTVDDQPLYSSLIAEELNSKGLITQSFVSGEDCIDSLHRKPDAILLDFELDPSETRMNGVDTLRKIKAELPDVPVLMLSAHDEINIVTTSMRFGAYDYIVKNETALVNINNKLKNIFHRSDMLQELRTIRNLKRGMFALAACALIFALFSNFLF